MQSTKRGLAWAGYYPNEKAQRPDPRPDDDLDLGLKRFQRDFGLKTDGFLRPGGETERTLDRVAGPLIEASARPTIAYATPDQTPPQPALRPVRRGEAVPGVQLYDVAAAGADTWNKPTAWAFGEAARQFDEAILEPVREAASAAAGTAAEAALEAASDVGRFVGLDDAADNLDHFRKGSGQDRVIPRDEARKRSPVIEGEKKNQKRFEETFTADRISPAGKKPRPQYEYRSHLLAMKHGETITVPDGPDETDAPRNHYDYERGYWGNAGRGQVDEALATGKSEVKSVAQDGFTATRDGNRILLEGDVTHSWNDKYDFKMGNPSSALATVARDHGGAREYRLRSSWKQRLRAEFEIIDGELVPRSFEWTDIPGSSERSK